MHDLSGLEVCPAPTGDMITWDGTVAWFGLVAPKGTPESVINKLSHALKDISENPKYQDQVKSTGAMASWLSKDDFTDLFNAEYTQWKTIVKESGAQID